eukprot:COSAG04_NODE_7165_length_1176_cov_1.065924_2_plen_50_part_00
MGTFEDTLGSGEEEEQANVAEQLIEAVLEKVVACVAPIRSWMLLRSVLA